MGIFNQCKNSGLSLLSSSFFSTIVFLSSTHADAQLIASESFNYPAGNITGNNGGYGWAGPWLTTIYNSANTTVAAPGLTMPPQVIGTGNQNHQVGNDYRNFRFLDTTSTQALSLMDNNGDPGLSASQNYVWGNGYGKDGTTIWFSFLINRSNNIQGYGGMHLMYGMDLSYDQYGNKKAHQRFQFGADNSHSNYMMSRTINANPFIPSCSQTVQGSVSVNGTTHLIVHRIDFKAGNETGYMWVDPVGCVTPDTSTADIKMHSICDFRFNAVNVGAGNSANYEMDELKIGLTYNDVVNCSTAGLTDLSNSSIIGTIIPNPSTGSSIASYYSSTQIDVQLCISNLMGQKITNKMLSLATGNNQIPLQLEDLPNGIYIVELNTSGIKLSSQKLIISR